MDDCWVCDGRGNIMCDCQACLECGIVDAYGFHHPDCVLVQYYDKTAVSV
jgi:hypothetical protein